MHVGAVWTGYGGFGKSHILWFHHLYFFPLLVLHYSCGGCIHFSITIHHYKQEEYRSFFRCRYKGARAQIPSDLRWLVFDCFLPPPYRHLPSIPLAHCYINRSKPTTTTSLSAVPFAGHPNSLHSPFSNVQSASNTSSHWQSLPWLV
jgi:hypothetical protein